MVEQVVHAARRVDGFFERWLWVPWVASILAVLVWVVAASMDRNPPLEMMSAEHAAGRQGEIVVLHARVLWDPHSECVGHYRRHLEDSAGGVFELPVSVPSEVRGDGEWLVRVQIPIEAAPGPAVVVTDGGAGLAWCVAGCSGSLPAFTVPVVDSTGAGDAFLAGLLHQLCAAPELLRVPAAAELTAVMRFAAACGALVCQTSGAIDPQPSCGAVERFLVLQD